MLNRNCHGSEILDIDKTVKASQLFLSAQRHLFLLYKKMLNKQQQDNYFLLVNMVSALLLRFSHILISATVGGQRENSE